MAKITKRPPAPSSVVISRSTSDKDRFTVRWKKATTTGEAAVQHQKVEFFYHKYDDKDGVWHPCKNGSYAVALADHSQSHVISSVDSSSTSVKKVKAVVTFTNRYEAKNKYGYVEHKDGSHSASDVITLHEVDSPTVTTKVDAGQLRVSIHFPSEEETKPLKGGTKKAATKYEIRKKVSGQASQVVKSRNYGDSTDPELTNHLLGTVSPSDATMYTITATVDGSVMYKNADGKWASNKTKTITRHVARPYTPEVKSVEVHGCSYHVRWDKRASEWHPVDSCKVMYSDVPQNQDESDAVASWTSMESGLKSSSYTTTIDGEIPVGTKRCFAVQSEHYGIPSNVKAYFKKSLYGEPEPPQSITVSNKVITVIASPKCCPTAVVKVYREQAGNSGLVRELKVSDGTQQSFTDTKVKTGVDVRYYARTVNTKTYGGMKSETVYSNDTVTPKETSFTSWSKSDDCESASLSWSQPTGSVSGYEVAWATAPDAFASNEQPSTLKLDGEDVTSCRISGLTPGLDYWFWIRTVATADGQEFRSNWKDGGKVGGVYRQAHLLMANAPEPPGITLSNDFVVYGGDSLGVAWSYSALGDMPQTSWKVTISGDGFEAKVTSSDDGMSAADESITMDTDDFPMGDLECTVTVGNSVGKASATVPLRVAVVPSATLALEGETVTALPVSATVNAGADNPETTEYTVEFENVGGIVQQLPNGERVHYDQTLTDAFGAIVGANELRPLLIDGGKYRARVVSTDPDTGLSSESDWSEFMVEWASPAAPPDLTVTNEGTTATITSDWDGSGILSIWRVTRDGVTLAVNSFEQGGTYVDSFAPFGDSHYRASIETDDGDVAFTDWSSNSDYQDIRFDFGGSFATLAYNISNGDSRESGDEVKRFLDGSKSAITKRGTNRTHSLGAVLVRTDDQDSLDRLYSLSRYDGVCFVRTPDGMAYPAVVTVGIDQEASNPLASVTITCTEVDDFGEFSADKVEVQ